MKKFSLRILSLPFKEIKEEILTQVSPTKIGAVKVTNKAKYYHILIRNVKSVVANIIKQEMLSIGADAIVARGSLDLSVDLTNVILVGNLKQYRLLAQKIKAQPFKLKFLGKEILELINNFEKDSFELYSKDRKLTFNNSKTYIMGILNVTPDSFSDGGEFINKESALKRVEQMLKEGADIIDIGGESTRPGSKRVSLEEELKRVIPIIDAINKNFPNTPISIDTYKSKVAKEAINHGAWIINDISGLKFDENMAKISVEEKIPVIIMHIKGTPENMQKEPKYINLINEITEYFEESLAILEKHNGDLNNIILDPGIGFGKTFEHNLEIIKRLKEFKSFGVPILIGASRKSFIGAILKKDNPKERVIGSLAVAAISAYNDAKIIRTHDIKETLETLKLVDAIKNCSF